VKNPIRETAKCARVGPLVVYRDTLHQWADEFDKLLNPWVSVDERLPEIDQTVIWRYDSGGSFTDHLDKDMDMAYIGLFVRGSELTGRITHWMPLPPLPENEK